MAKYIKDLKLPDIGEGPFKFVYTYWHRNRGRIDLANPLSIIDKFVSDGLVAEGVIGDDSTEYIKEVVFKYDGIEPPDGLCILRIYKHEENDG